MSVIIIIILFHYSIVKACSPLFYAVEVLIYAILIVFTLWAYYYIRKTQDTVAIVFNKGTIITFIIITVLLLSSLGDINWNTFTLIRPLIFGFIGFLSGLLGIGGIYTFNNKYY